MHNQHPKKLALIVVIDGARLDRIKVQTVSDHSRSK